jgi:hypothetical protein
MQITNSTGSSPEQTSLSAPQPTNPVIHHSPSTESYVRRVRNILSNIGVVAPGRDLLQAITDAALKAQQLFFAAALFHPGTIDFDHFFEEFVRLCACPVPKPYAVAPLV